MKIKYKFFMKHQCINWNIKFCFIFAKVAQVVADLRHLPFTLKVREKIQRLLFANHVYHHWIVKWRSPLNTVNYFYWAEDAVNAFFLWDVNYMHWQLYHCWNGINPFVICNSYSMHISMLKFSGIFQLNAVRYSCRHVTKDHLIRNTITAIAKRLFKMNELNQWAEK